MTRKSLLLFAATSVIWGSSFLFIRLAVEHVPPATVVFGRTLLGAAFLVPLAASRQAFRGIRPVIVPVIVVTVLDMAAPRRIVELLGPDLANLREPSLGHGLRDGPRDSRTGQQDRPAGPGHSGGGRPVPRRD